MNVLFIRIYLSALAFLLMAFFLIMFVANSVIYNRLLIDTSESMHQVIAQALMQEKPVDWQDKVKTYNALVTDYTVSLIALDSLNKDEQQQLSSRNTQTILSDNIPGRADLYTLSKLPDSNWILKIDEDDSTGDLLSERVDAIIIFVLLMAPLAFALFLLVRKLTSPIQHLTQVAEKLGKGDWSARANQNLAPPMNTLAQGFNTMAEQLDHTIKEQQVLIGAIPHELRSPLGKIRFALDMTRDKETLAALRENIENIDGYVDEMQAAVDEILELNRLQNKANIELTPVKLCRLLNALIDSRSTDAPELKFSIDCAASMKVFAHTSLLKRAIQNLLQNAERYAQSAIKVSARQEGNAVIICVDDDGEGIAKEKRSLLFTPFTTLDSSRSRSTGGIGLGLAIVKIIMQKHSGDVSVTRSPMGGARFELRWMLTNADKP